MRAPRCCIKMTPDTPNDGRGFIKGSAGEDTTADTALCHVPCTYEVTLLRRRGEKPPAWRGQDRGRLAYTDVFTACPERTCPLALAILATAMVTSSLMQGAHGLILNLECGGLYEVDIIRAVLRRKLTHVVATDEATAQALVARSTPSA